MLTHDTKHPASAGEIIIGLRDVRVVKYVPRADGEGSDYRDLCPPICLQAAAEIERLRSENATLTDTLGRSVALHAEFDAEIERLQAALRRALYGDAISGKGES